MKPPSYGTNCRVYLINNQAIRITLADDHAIKSDGLDLSKWCRAVDIRIDLNEIPSAKIEVIGIETDILAQLAEVKVIHEKQMVCPDCLRRKWQA